MKHHTKTLFTWLKATWFASPNAQAHSLLRAGQHFQRSGHWRMARFFHRRLQKNHGVHIHPKARLGKDFNMPHPTGIVIGEGVVIEDNVTLYQNTTLGAARNGDWQKGHYPHIGEGSTIFAGAVIIGDIVIGKHCTIGANAVVTTHLPDNTTAAGVPAKIVKSQHD